MADNPFLAPYDTKYEIPPFDKIEYGHYLAALDRAFEGALAGGALGLLVRAQRPSGTLLETLVTPSLETRGAWRVSRVADGTPLGHGEGLAKAQVLEELRAIPAPVTATAFV